MMEVANNILLIDKMRLSIIGTWLKFETISTTSIIQNHQDKDDSEYDSIFHHFYDNNEMRISYDR